MVENHPSENDCIIIKDREDKKKNATACTIQMYQGDHIKLI